MAKSEHPLIQFFEYRHLPRHLQDISAPFRQLAVSMDLSCPKGEELTMALRKLLEAKDCAVRSIVYKEPKDGNE